MQRFLHRKKSETQTAKKVPSGTRMMTMLLLLVAAVGMYHVLQEIYSVQHAQQVHAALADSVAAVRAEEAQATAPPPEQPAATPFRELEPTEEPAPQILPQYQELYAENNDMIGWIKIEGTSIDYPVMYTPDDEKYLYQNFYGESSPSGMICMDHRCQPDSDNLIIHGHKLIQGTMFTDLFKYAKKGFWQKHPVIHFDTLYEQQDFEVLAAFYDKVYLNTDTCFKYYDFITAADTDEFDAAIAYYKENELYDTGVTAEYGDQLITLTTCSYHEKNGRFIVVAKKIR